MARKYKFRFRNVKTQEVQEEVGYGGTKRVAEKLLDEASRVKADLDKTPTDQVFGERLAIGKERIAHLKQEMETRRELQDYFLNSFSDLSFYFFL